LNDLRGYVDAGFGREIGAKTDLEVRAYYDRYSFTGSGDYAVPGIPAEFGGWEKAKGEWVGAEATITRSLGEQKITAGSQYQYSLKNQQSAGLIDEGTFFSFEETPWQSAVFADAELHIVPRAIVHAGARGDWFSNYNAALSPRAALIYTLDDRTAVKYIVGKAFRIPNAYEEYYADGITVAMAPRKLVPERILSHEVVFERDLKKWLSVSADGFYNQLKELIDQVPAGETTLSEFVNDDRVHANGLEVAASSGNQTLSLSGLSSSDGAKR